MHSGIHRRPGIRRLRDPGRGQTLPGGRRGFDVRQQHAVIVVRHAASSPAFCQWIPDSLAPVLCGSVADLVHSVPSGSSEDRTDRESDLVGGIVLAARRHGRCPRTVIGVSHDAVRISARSAAAAEGRSRSVRSTGARSPIALRGGRRPCDSQTTVRHALPFATLKTNGAPMRPVFLVKQLARSALPRLPAPARQCVRVWCLQRASAAPPR